MRHSETTQRALALALDSKLGSFDVGGATLSALKKKGWVYEIQTDPARTCGRRYTLSPEGLEVFRGRAPLRTLCSEHDSPITFYAGESVTVLAARLREEFSCAVRIEKAKFPNCPTLKDGDHDWHVFLLPVKHHAAARVYCKAWEQGRRDGIDLHQGRTVHLTQAERDAAFEASVAASRATGTAP